MKTNLRAANLKQEYAETVLRTRAAESEILIEDNAKVKDFRVRLKRKASILSSFTKYDVWMLEGIRESQGRCEECVILLPMTINIASIVTDAGNILEKEEHGASFQYLDWVLERRIKDGKSYFVAK